MRLLKLFSISFFVLTLCLPLGISSAVQENTDQNKVESWKFTPDLNYIVDSRYQEELEKLYELSESQLIWSKAGKLTSQSFEVIQSLRQADQMGLKSEEYLSDQLLKLLSDLTIQSTNNKSDLADFDVRLSFALMKFISDLHLGRVDPRETGFDVVINQKRMKLAETVFAYSRSNNLWEAIKQLEPRFQAYQRLKAALFQYRQLVADYEWQPLQYEETVHPGDVYPDLATLRLLLIAVGDLVSDHLNTDLYEGELVEAVKRFQKRHGLEADGLIGKKTFQQLNIPLSKRIEQIELALERLRWLPDLKDGPHIVVNIPAFELYGFQVKNAVESLELKMGVIVGSTLDKHETPVFMADMEYLVFRPYWNVPYTITVKELIPKIKQDPGYLYNHNYEILNGHTIVSTGFFDQMMANELRAGKLRIRQKPGGSNALGLIKFIFPNSNSVYLHDTPTRHLFSQSRRDFSHGCIRVENPVALAEFVLGFQGQGWDRTSIGRAMNKGVNDQKVALRERIPVHIFYTTAIVRENGDIAFFDDIYGHDKRLSQLLNSVQRSDQN